jgi:hypothetical protein
MEIAVVILTLLGAVISFAIPLIKKRIERRDHVDSAIGQRDRDVLRDGLDRMRGNKPVPEGSQTKL